MRNHSNYSRLYQAIIKAYSSIPMSLAPGFAAPPLQVFVELTYRCNLHCSFCQFLQAENESKPQHSDSRRQELSSTEFQQLVAAIPRTSIISFTGGEPLLKEGIIDLLRYSAGRNKTHIFTNATRVDEKLADDLCKLAARNIFGQGLVLVGISLEGTKETHNRIAGKSWAFDRTIQGIEALVAQRTARKQRYPLIELKTVISAENVGDISEVFHIARSRRVDIFNLMILNQLPHADRIDKGDKVSIQQPPPALRQVDLHVLKEQLQVIEREAIGAPIQIRTTPQGITFEQIIRYYSNDLRTFNGCRCFYPWYGFGITAYGDVSICPYVPLGNLRNSNLKALLNNQQAKDFRRQLRKHRFYPGCRGCCMLVP